MTLRIFVAGATGAIGQRLVPLLLDSGHQITGATRSSRKADALRAAGADAVVVDVFDAEGLGNAVSVVRPHVVIHQLTDLPHGLDQTRMANAAVRNARVRDEGTRNLMRAALAAGVGKVVAQSIIWAYAPGPEPHAEDDPLDEHTEGGRAVSIRGVIALEKQVLGSPPIIGVVLRYGQLYGPGPASMKHGVPRRCTSMRRLAPHCSRRSAAGPEF